MRKYTDGASDHRAEAAASGLCCLNSQGTWKRRGPCRLPQVTWRSHSLNSIPHLCTQKNLAFPFTHALSNLYFIPSVRKQPLYPLPLLSLHLEGMSSIPFRQLVREIGNRKPWHWRAVISQLTYSVRICDKQHSLSDEVSISQTLKCSNCLSATYWSYNTEDCQL